jgi:hypothetical protein
LIREVRDSAPLRDIPIVVMSAGTLDRNLVTPKTRFLPKPFEFDRLLEVVTQLLG